MVDRSTLRDLYKQRGKKLAGEEENSKIKAQEELDEGTARLVQSHPLSSEVRLKVLRMRPDLTLPIRQGGSPQVEKGGVEGLALVVLGLGLNYQRMTGETVSDWGQFLHVLKQEHPQWSWVTTDELWESLAFLGREGLLYRYEDRGRVLFEPLEASADVHVILRLVGSDGSVTLAELDRQLPTWTLDRIKRRIALLETNGLALVEGSTVWVPQLAQ